MAGSNEVFVSHAARDATVAERIAAKLERAGVKCWFAARDQTPGVSYAEGIIDAINNSRVMVLVLSGDANASPHVLREVERAVAKNLALVPVRLDAVALSKPLEYLVSSQHWLDVSRPPTADQLDRLAGAVAQALGQSAASAAPPDSARRRGRVFLLLVPVFVAALVWAGFLLFRNRSPATPVARRAESTSAVSSDKPSSLLQQYSQEGLALELWTPRGRDPLYYNGEAVQVSIKASIDCHLYAFDVSPESSIFWLVANSLGRNAVQGQRVYTIPDDIGRLVDFTVSPPYGPDVIKAFASGPRLPIESLFALPGTIEEKILNVRNYVTSLPVPIPYAEQFLILRTAAKR